MLVAYQNKKDDHFRKNIEKRLYSLGMQHKVMVEENNRELLSRARRGSRRASIMQGGKLVLPKTEQIDWRAQIDNVKSYDAYNAAHPEFNLYAKNAYSSEKAPHS